MNRNQKTLTITTSGCGESRGVSCSARLAAVAEYLALSSVVANHKY
jgi:hypothetical protein